MHKKQRGLWGDDKPLRERRAADTGQVDMFGAVASDDWGRRSRPQSDDKLTLTLQHEDPRTETQREADAQAAAQAATRPLSRLLFGKLVTTPLMMQVAALKEELETHAPGAILLFRLGDFYEAFGTDAEHLARACDLVLTSRPIATNNRLAMAGVPTHCVGAYIDQLVVKGYSVGVADHLAEPNGQGLAERVLTHIEEEQ